ncbi:hypothetical protein FGU65_04490 [Methanoculleus sp. FWC-SCC1]|uniref:Uncharacterized protein n=1 Tax=Methanoculleus frigidifontis TaxID=2584085 RepID=A0ABT8M8C4_9EURY|nr:hypothetical protein [Methanoculleus sp. FWC-SCC1]MDN7024154.1 hypothetical protein [Methanoculleus sp. FWC-SCC1]
MVLEEELLFLEKTEAEEFLKFIRSAGCSGKVRTVHDLVPDTMFRGRIRDFLILLEKEIARIEASPDDAEPVAIYVTLKKAMESRLEKLRAFLQEHAVGELVPEKAVLTDIVTLIGEARAKEGIEEEERARIDDTLAAIGVDALLEDNELVERTDEGRRFVRSIDPEEAYTYLPDYPLCEMEPETLSEHGISVKLTVFAEERYAVSMGPDILLIDDRDRLWQVLDEMDIDEDSYFAFRNNSTFSQFIVDRIMTFLEERGRASKEEVIEETLSFDTRLLEEQQNLASFVLTEEYVDGILTDLKKLGLIAGKDAKLKPVRVR